MSFFPITPVEISLAWELLKAWISVTLESDLRVDAAPPMPGWQAPLEPHREATGKSKEGQAERCQNSQQVSHLAEPILTTGPEDDNVLGGVPLGGIWT